MSYLSITHYIGLMELVDRLQDAPVIAYDTEFISEGRYWPELCLIQLAAGKTQALIDPLAEMDLKPLWELFCDGRREIVVHACRSEMEFCYREIGRMPSKLFDVQVAAGFLGVDYPAGFGTLLDKFLHIHLPKAESRTEWNKRPLTPRQIEYALGDVQHLEEMVELLRKKLDEKNRLDWYYAEIDDIKKRLQNDFSIPRWRNLPKTSSMKPKELAILREVWLWRDGVAKKLNQPASRVLRDDLVVELAKRGTADPKRISGIRGFQRGDLNRILPGICDAIERALALPSDKQPEMGDRFTYPQYTVMTQFLYSALCSICRKHHISQQLVGGPNDVRELIAFELKTLPEGIKPRLLEGWRAKLVGNLLDDLLNGRTAIKLDRTRPDELILE